MIAAIQRASVYSPNHVNNDTAIFNLTVEALRQQGEEVVCYTEEAFKRSSTHYPTIFSMGRMPSTIELLTGHEQAGSYVVNSPQGVTNCYRENMTVRLIDAGIPHPQSIIVPTHSDVKMLLEQNEIHECWVKRADYHAIHREDVSYSRNTIETQTVLHEYALRNITRAVINRHIVGDLVKFYGVRGTPFFYWFYPLEINHSKWGYEQINGASRGYRFDRTQMQALCNRAAEALSIEVYGGDCIVTDRGEMYLIDLNDWPSFAPCRREAAPYIASLIRK